MPRVCPSVPGGGAGCRAQKKTHMGGHVGLGCVYCVTGGFGLFWLYAGAWGGCSYSGLPGVYYSPYTLRRAARATSAVPPNIFLPLSHNAKKRQGWVVLGGFAVFVAFCQSVISYIMFRCRCISVACAWLLLALLCTAAPWLMVPASGWLWVASTSRAFFM